MPLSSRPEDKEELLYDPVLAARLLKRDGTEREKTRTRKMKKILSVAISVFAREGTRGFSIRRIAADAGITLSTLQHYFGNRDNLLIITINSLVAKYIADYIDIARDADLPPARRLELIVDDLFDAIKDPVLRAFYGHLWATAAQDEAIRDLVRESYTKYYEALTLVVSAMRPDLPLKRATTLSTAIGAQVDGMLVARIISPHSLPDWDTVAADAKALWFDMIAKETAAG